MATDLDTLACLPVPVASGPSARHMTVPVDVGGVLVGGGAPVVVQSMTNTDTADIDGTVAQVAALARAGSEIVRITVDRDEAAAAVPHIRDKLARRGIHVPLIGDFHYIGHKLLADHPGLRRGAGQISHQSGNVGFKEKRDTPVRRHRRTGDQARQSPCGSVSNWGSLDQELLTQLMDENAGAPRRSTRAPSRAKRSSSPRCSRPSGRRRSAWPRPDHSLGQGVGRAGPHRGLSQLAARCDYALHLGLTEAGMGSKGIVASSAAMGILLQQGIGDTIRVSLTPEPGGDRTVEVKVAQELLQTMGFRTFVPLVAACPGCGRTTSTVFQELARTSRTDLQRPCPNGRDAIRASRR